MIERKHENATTSKSESTKTFIIHGRNRPPYIAEFVIYVLTSNAVCRRPSIPMIDTWENDPFDW